MSGGASFRRAVAELRPGAPLSAWSMIGTRSLHQFWPQLAPHFRSVLLPPQRRADSGAVSWTWRAADGPASPSPEELAGVRRRLESAGRAFADAGKRPGADRETESGCGAQIQAGVQAMVAALIAAPDAELSGFVGRADCGLMMHSWGAAVPAHTYFPDTHDGEVSGVVIGGEDGAAGINLVLQNPQEVVLARVQTDASGAFRFQKIGPGDYRIRVTGRGDFPATGFLVTVGRESVVSLELRRGATVATFAPGVGRERARGAARPGLAVGRRGVRLRRIHLLLAGLVGVLIVGGWRWLGPRAEPGRTHAAAPAWWQSARGKLAAIMRPAATSATSVSGAPRLTDVALALSGKMGRPEPTGESEAGAPPLPPERGDSPAKQLLPSTSLASRVAAEMISPPRVPPDAMPTTVTGRPSAPGTAPDSEAARPGDGARMPLAAENRTAVARLESPSDAPREVSPAVAGSARVPEPTAGDSGSEVFIQKAENPGAQSGNGAGGQNSGATSSGVLAVGASFAPSGSAPSSTVGPESGGGPVTAAPLAGGLRRDSSAVAPSRTAVAGEPRLPSVQTPPSVGTSAGGGTANKPSTVGGGKGSGRAIPSPVATAPAEGRLELPAAAGSDRVGATSASGPLAHRWRIGVSEFKLRLVLDAVLATIPVPVGGDDSIEIVRRRELRDRHERRPAALERAIVVQGFTVELFESDVARGREPRWLDSGEAGGETAVVQGTRAEVSWPAGSPFRVWRRVLRHPDGRELAWVRMAPDGVGVLESSNVVRAWHWIAIDCGPDRQGFVRPLEWRFHSGAPVPATWRRDDRWRGGRGYRLDLPLASERAEPSAFALALVDPASGWGLAGEVFRP